MLRENLVEHQFWSIAIVGAFWQRFGLHFWSYLSVNIFLENSILLHDALSKNSQGDQIFDMSRVMYHEVEFRDESHWWIKFSEFGMVSCVHIGESAILLKSFHLVCNKWELFTQSNADCWIFCVPLKRLIKVDLNWTWLYDHSKTQCWSIWSLC